MNGSQWEDCWERMEVSADLIVFEVSKLCRGVDWTQQTGWFASEMLSELIYRDANESHFRQESLLIPVYIWEYVSDLEGHLRAQEITLLEWKTFIFSSWMLATIIICLFFCYSPLIIISYYSTSSYCKRLKYTVWPFWFITIEWCLWHFLPLLHVSL